jgi:hypothetical protein
MIGRTKNRVEFAAVDATVRRIALIRAEIA